MKDMTKTVPLASLVVDPAIYPRRAPDETHTSDLLRALQAGAVLPPIIADRATLRIVDGVHRRAALLRYLGPEGLAPVILRAYPDDKTLFLDAVTLNSAHGRKLDRDDQVRIVLRLRDLGAADAEIAFRLHIPEPVVQKLSLRVVMTPAGLAPSKRGFEHLAGQALNAAQVAAMDSVRSGEVGRLCLELSRMLEQHLVDLEDPAVVEQLRGLARAIDAALHVTA
jgi:hypothetical protein